jgi:hypothetical protein
VVMKIESVLEKSTVGGWRDGIIKRYTRRLLTLDL